MRWHPELWQGKLLTLITGLALLIGATAGEVVAGSARAGEILPQATPVLTSTISGTVSDAAKHMAVVDVEVG